MKLSPNIPSDDELLDNAASLLESVVEDRASFMTGFKSSVVAWLSAYREKKALMKKGNQS